jgi:hypothetical protein
MAMTSHDKWYQKINGAEKPLVRGNSWYKCVISTKNPLVSRDCSCYQITSVNSLLVLRTKEIIVLGGD